jgi:hypothetical protein
LVINGAALIVGCCTGMVVTRRVAPLAGAGTPVLILPLTIWASGAPLAAAITGVAAYRLLGVLSLPPALASLPVLRGTTRQAAITRQGNSAQRGDRAFLKCGRHRNDERRLLPSPHGPCR